MGNKLRFGQLKRNEKSPLIAAIKKSDVGLVSQLIDAGHDPNDNWFGLTPLHFAVMTGSVECVVELLRRGAKISVLQQPDPTYASRFEMSPLHAAAMFGNEQIVDILLDHGAQHCIDRSGLSPLHYAAYYQHLDVILALLRRGIRAEAKAIQIAILKENVPILKALINDNPEQLDNIDCLYLKIIKTDVVLLLLLYSGYQFKDVLDMPVHSVGDEYSFYYLIHSSKPLSLKNSCRVVIRNMFKHQQLDKYLLTINLPKSVIDFLLMSDF